MHRNKALPLTSMPLTFMPICSDAEDALAVARENAYIHINDKEYYSRDRAEFVRGDFGRLDEAGPLDDLGPFDAILCNPPYVTHRHHNQAFVI